MASKKYLELKEFTDSELQSELKETETQFSKLKFDHAIKGLDNPLVIKEIRRDIARLKSEARRREIAVMSEEELNARSKKRLRRKIHK